MNINQTCPPIPTLNELTNRNKYIRIDPTDVVLNEFLVMRHLGDIRCIQIVNVFTDYDTRVTSQFTYSENGNGPTIGVRVNYFNNEGGELYRKSPRKDFDDTVSMLNKRIDNNTIGNIPQAKRDVLGNPDLSNLIGNNLALQTLSPRRPSKGGRRKRAGTKRTRKNKRKSTRRIGRKYKK
jgi:hypothetical protein